MTLIQPAELRIELPLEALATRCCELGVSELAVFGSALRDDFGPGSDIDFLVRFENNNAGPWLGKLQDLQASLEKMLGRSVDVVDWHGIEQSHNLYRKEQILQSSRLIYAAR